MTKSIPDIKKVILAQERSFTNSLASAVLEKPGLSVWMILIPIIFLYYFYKFHEYSQGRKQFVENYLSTREKALDEAAAALSDHRDPDPEGIFSLPGIPGNAIKRHRELVSLLIEHYTGLIKSGEKSYEDMARAVYRERSNYLMMAAHINRAEMALNRALRPHIERESGSVSEVIRTLEATSERLRREAAEKIFP